MGRFYHSHFIECQETYSDRLNREKAFNRKLCGIWPPKCAYSNGLENYLRDTELRWFSLDTHGLLFGNLRYAIYLPCFTAAGPTAFGWDRESSKQVWSTQEGYSVYRNFYPDIGYDLDLEYLGPFRSPDGIRKFTGIKYHRIPGCTSKKEIYVQGGQIEWPITMPVISNHCFPEEMVSP